MTIRINASRISAYSECRKKDYWFYEEKIVPKMLNWNLEYGTIIHEIMENFIFSFDTWFNKDQVKLTAIKQWLEKRMGSLANSPYCSLDDFQLEIEKAKIVGMIIGFLDSEYYKNIIEKTEVKLSEKTLSMKSDGIEFFGTLDFLFKTKQKKKTINFVDFKALSVFSPENTEDLVNSWQLPLYYLIAKNAFPGHVIRPYYIVFKKTKKTVHKNETINDFRIRMEEEWLNNNIFMVPVVLLKQVLAELLQDMKQIATEIHANKNELRPRDPSSCNKRFSRCPYYSLCWEGESKENMGMFFTKGENRKGGDTKKTQKNRD